MCRAGGCIKSKLSLAIFSESSINFALNCWGESFAMSASVHARKMRWLLRDKDVRDLEKMVVKLTPRVLMVLLD